MIPLWRYAAVGREPQCAILASVCDRRALFQDGADEVILLGKKREDENPVIQQRERGGGGGVEWVGVSPLTVGALGRSVNIWTRDKA